MLGLKRPDILEMPIDAVILESVVTWLIGEALNNSSTVDRLWSFLPTLYTGKQSEGGFHVVSSNVNHESHLLVLHRILCIPSVIQLGAC